MASRSPITVGEGIAISERSEDNAKNEREFEPYELSSADETGDDSDASRARGAAADDADANASGADDAADDVYELQDEEEGAPSPSSLDRLAADPRAAGAVDTDESEAAPAPPATSEKREGAAERPVPSIHSSEQPKYVNPEVAARRREEARARAAEQMAIEARERARRNLIIGGILLAVIALIVLFFMLGD